MFSRKNVMQPKPLDLREVVSNLSKMLKRLLGETITLEFNPPPELPLVQADTGMIEQVIMNLAVNARDAMPNGGTLTISTNPVEMNDAYVQTHPEARLGRVRLPARERHRLRHGSGHAWPASSSRSSPPRKSAKAPAWAWRRFMASSNSTRAGLKSAARSAKARTFNVFFPASERAGQSAAAGDRPAPPGAGRPRDDSGGGGRTGAARHGAPDSAGLRLQRAGSGLRRGSLASLGTQSRGALTWC